MIQILTKKGPVIFQYSIFKKERSFNHFISSRLFNQNIENKYVMNIGYNTSDIPANVTKNRELLAHSLGLEPYDIIFPQQTHSSNIQIITQHLPSSELPDTDALITNKPGICIAIQTADCVPVLLADPCKKVVAAVHAGWRGTHGHIVEKSIKSMISEFGCLPKDIIAGIGPSISCKNYEVGSDVFSKFEKYFNGKILQFIDFKDNNKANLDLWAINKFQITEMGVPQSNIEESGFCTYDYSHLFFSSRKDNGVTGRFASGIMIV